MTTISSMPLLRVEHLTMRFGGLVAVGDLSFDVARGQITALIGPNGAGKTTVFNCITGFYKPTEGRLTLNHDANHHYLLERLPDHDINWKARVARTFQNIRLFQGMTVLENLLVAQHNTLMRASGSSLLGLFNAKSYRDQADLVKFWKSMAAVLICLIGRMMRRGICPMAISGGSKLPAPCARIRSCCVWTNRLRASTRKRALN